jgi:hypothetical protein
MSLLLICGVDQTPVWWWSVESWKETAAEAKQSKGTNVEGQAYRRRQLIHDATKAAYSMLRALNCVRVTNMRMTQQLSTSAPQVGPGWSTEGFAITAIQRSGSVAQEPQPKHMHTSTFTTNACETPQHNTVHHSADQRSAREPDVLVQLLCLCTRPQKGAFMLSWSSHVLRISCCLL